MSEAAVLVDCVTKRWGDFTAVDNVSFTIERGSAAGIVGESGAGKSTLARMLAGLTPLTSGSISVCGRDRSRAQSSKHERLTRARELQVVFQDPYASLDPLQTPGQAIGEILRLHRSDLAAAARTKRVTELAETVGLDGHQMNAAPRELSGGQRQRVAIAKALATEPHVLVLDEAVSALDVSIQAQVLNLLNDIRDATQMTYVFITHNLAVVRQVTDHCIVMHHGKVVEDDRTERLLVQPQAPYTRRLIASVPRPGWRPVRRPPMLVQAPTKESP